MGDEATAERYWLWEELGGWKVGFGLPEVGSRILLTLGEAPAVFLAAEDGGGVGGGFRIPACWSHISKAAAFVLDSPIKPKATVASWQGPKWAGARRAFAAASLALAVRRGAGAGAGLGMGMGMGLPGFAEEQRSSAGRGVGPPCSAHLPAPPHPDHSNAQHCESVKARGALANYGMGRAGEESVDVAGRCCRGVFFRGWEAWAKAAEGGV